MNQNIPPVNKLLNNCHELLCLPIELPNDFRQKINRFFALFEERCLKERIKFFFVQQSRYALASFLDEFALTQDWQGRIAWRNKTLQLEFFGEHLAGENYFKKLLELRQDPYKNIDVIEIYYVCLQLGFQGMYRKNHASKLEALKINLRDQIQLTRGKNDLDLFSLGLPQITQGIKRRYELSLWIIGSIIIAVVFFIYVGYDCAINYVATKSLERINLNHQLLKEGFHVGDVK